MDAFGKECQDFALQTHSSHAYAVMVLDTMRVLPVNVVELRFNGA
jgi:hypothetical protein